MKSDGHKLNPTIYELITTLSSRLKLTTSHKKAVLEFPSQNSYLIIQLLINLLLIVLHSLILIQQLA
jgi:hypothetical protein